MTKDATDSAKPEAPADPPRQRRKPGRVPVSCAECRRLKLRCDRKVPCEKCVKRGCSAICPDGALTTGNKTNRLAFADAEELQKKVERLRNRVGTLEEALRILQTSFSDDPHPLLRGEPAFDSASASPMPRAVPPVCPPGPSTGLPRDEEEFIDAFGTLTLGLRGESRFFGQTSRSEYLIHASQADTIDEVCSRETFVHLPDRVYDEAVKGLDTTCHDMEVKQQVWQMLPSLSQACTLCEAFLEHGEYLWFPISREQLFDEILSVIYRSSHDVPGQCQLVSTHAASLLYIVFALATNMDPKLPPYSVEASEFYLLSRLCLRFAASMQDTTLWAIQSLVYQVKFLQYWDKAPGYTLSHTAWILSGFAVKLGHSIGLHVKSSRWQLCEQSAQRRAQVFWQLFLVDTWLSFSFGRPPCISLAFVDCEFPKDPEESVDAEGHREWGFHPWTWQYAKLLHNVMTSAFGAKAPTYPTVIELDRKIRDFPAPWKYRVRCGQADEPEPKKTLHMQRWFVMSCKEITLLNLHRPYFAQVLSAAPHDPLKHRYGPSVIAIYRAAWRLIEGLITTHKRTPFIMERLSTPWSQALSAGIVMCLMVTRAPTSALAPASLHELDRLCEIFEKLQGRSQTAANNLDAVRKLQRQAHDAINKVEMLDKTHPAFTELDRIGGKTHLISPLVVPASSPSPGSSPSSHTDSSSSASSTPGSSIYEASITPGHNQDNIHPVLVSDLRTFEGWTCGGQSGDRPFDFNFDLSQAFPLPVETLHPSDFQTLQDISGYLGPDFFGSGPHALATAQSSVDISMHTEPLMNNSPLIPNMGDMSAAAPVLDATWQSFVEQLGF